MNADLLHTVDDLNNTAVNDELPITPTNRSLLEFYAVHPDSSYAAHYYPDPFFGIPDIFLPIRWLFINESDDRTIVRPFECFGDLDTSEKTLMIYVNSSRGVQQDEQGNPYKAYTEPLTLTSTMTTATHTAH